MADKSDIEIIKAAIIGGLDLYGLPNNASDAGRYIELFGIDITRYRRVHDCGLMISGNEMPFGEILHVKASERALNDFENIGEDALEDPFVIDDHEFVFFPESSTAIDAAGESFYDQKFRAWDGNVYISGWFDTKIIEIDVTEEECFAMMERKLEDDKRLV